MLLSETVDFGSERAPFGLGPLPLGPACSGMRDAACEGMCESAGPGKRPDVSGTTVVGACVVGIGVAVGAAVVGSSVVGVLVVATGVSVGASVKVGGTYVFSVYICVTSEMTNTAAVEFSAAASPLPPIKKTPH